MREYARIDDANALREENERLRAVCRDVADSLEDRRGYCPTCSADHWLIYFDQNDTVYNAVSTLREAGGDK